jgi:hypothetical protein
MRLGVRLAIEGDPALHQLRKMLGNQLPGSRDVNVRFVAGLIAEFAVRRKPSPSSVGIDILPT